MTDSHDRKQIIRRSIFGDQNGDVREYVNHTFRQVYSSCMLSLKYLECGRTPIPLDGDVLWSFPLRHLKRTDDDPLYRNKTILLDRQFEFTNPVSENPL